MGFSNPFRSSSSASNPENESLIITHHHQYNPDTSIGDHVRDTDTRGKATILLSTLFIFVGIVTLATLVGRDPRFRSPVVLNVMEPGVAEGVSKKSHGVQLLGADTKNSWNKHMLDWQRTAFHFQPNKNWMNDPNGPLYYKGWYHLFYQYNPESAMWGNIVWGHAASTDLVHWIHLPTAMYPDQWYDSNGVWTGSTTKLPDGRLIVLYTGATDDFVQVQNLAYPANLSDPLLIDWIKYPGNPVIEPPQGVHDHDFRDPTTAWLTPQGKWRISIGSKHNRTGIALLYDTDDFETYELLGEMLHGVSGTGMWECVDFYPVSKTKNVGLDTSDNGKDVKHVVKTSLDDDRNDYYSLGTYQDSGKWTPDDAKIDVGIGLRYDYGLFYASKTFFDDDKKRRILWGWIPESDSVGADIKKGWASLQAVPRTVLLDKKTESNLVQWPVEEIEKLRSKSWEFSRDLEPGSVVPLKVDDASQLDIVVEFELDEATVKKVNGETDQTSDSCKEMGGTSKRGALGPFGLMVLADKDLIEYTAVYFYISKSSNGNLNTLFCTDQTRSSEARDVLKPIYGSTVPVLKGEKLTMRILVDHSIVEGFSQGGRTCITSRVYPTKALYDDAQLFLFNNATDSNVSFSLKIWQMDSSVIPTSSAPRLENLLSFLFIFVVSIVSLLSIS